MNRFWLALVLGFFIFGCGKEESHSLVDPQTQSEKFEVVTTMFSDGTGITMTNAATSGSEILNNLSRTVVNLTGFEQIRGHFASSLTSNLIGCRIEYSLDNGSSWQIMVSDFFASTVANENASSAPTTIPERSKTSVLLRAVILGNGALDPVIRYVRVGYI